jgi:hypothetical protein
MPKFCHNCGKEAQPLWKACPYCETSFASLSSKPAALVEKQDDIATVIAVDRGYGDDSYIDRANSLSEILRGRRIRGFEFEVNRPAPVKETVGSVHAQATNAPVEIFARPAPYANVDGEAFLKDFQKEAGTRGPGIKDSDNIA